MKLERGKYFKAAWAPPTLSSYDAVIVLGCESAAATVRECVQSTDCKVVEGMKTVGITNAQPRIGLACHVYFEDCKTVPLPQHRCNF